MNTATHKPLEIFRPGRHVAMSGAVLAFSETDLAATAAAYDPALHEAPLVVGHPRHDIPAYGWVKSLAAGAGLEAEPHQVNPVFAEWVNSGALKKISAAFYAPDAPNNPVPGVYYLRHVGFLGAQPPAVKGLRAPEFADAEEGVVEFGDWSDQQNAGLWRSLRDWLIGKFGIEEADKVVSPWVVSSLEVDAHQEVADTAVPTFTEPTTQEISVTPEAAAALEAENARLKQQLADTAARDRAAAVSARHAGHLAFAETLAGKVRADQAPVVVAALDLIAGQEAAVEFGEGDAKRPLVDAIRDLFASLPDQVEFSEAATKDKAIGAGSAGVDVTDANAIAAAALEFQEVEAKAGRQITVTTAVQHVTAVAK